MRILTRFIYPWVYSFILLIIGTSVAYADTSTNTLTFNIQNNNTAAFNNYPFIIPLNNTQLVNLGYISASGLNTQTSRTTTAVNFPSGLSNVNLTVLVDQCLGNRVNTYSYKMGYDPARTDIDIITGNGGYVSVADSSTLEPSIGTVTYTNTTAWYNPAWTYRKNLTVYGSSAGVQTNYQKLIRVYKADAGADMPENLAQYTTGNDNVISLYGAFYDAQTFTAEATATAKKVWIKMSRVLAGAGTLTVAIYSVHGADNHPNASLCSGTINSAYLSTTSDWYEIDLGAGTGLTSGTVYAIVMSVAAGDVANKVVWAYDSSAPAYAGGSLAQSGDRGANWVMYTNFQGMFQVISTTTGTVPLRVDTEAHCLANFNDLRFTKADGTTLLNYWIENSATCAADGYADCWVELDTIAQMTSLTEHSQFCMYYGNAGAAAVSSGSSTMVQFDNFDSYANGSSMNGQGGWTVSAPSIIVSQDHAFSGTQCAKIVGGATYGALYRSLAATSNTYLIGEYQWKEDATYANIFMWDNGVQGCAPGIPNTELLRFIDWASADISTGIATTADAWRNYQQYNHKFATAGSYVMQYQQGVSYTCQLANSAPYGNNIVAGRDQANGAGNDAYVDDFYVANFTVSQPLWGVPAAQEIFSSTSVVQYQPLTFYTSWKGYFDNSTSGYLFGRPSSFSFNSTGSGGVSVYGNSTSLISYSPVTSGTHNITIYTPTNYTLKLDIDGVNVASSAIGNISDTSTSWFISSSGPARSTEWFYYKIGGSRKIYYQPTNIIVGSTLPDLSGMGNHGTIVWGTNPTGTGTYTSGIAATGSYVMGSSTIDPDLTPKIIPVPGSVNLSGDPTHTSTPPIIPPGYNPAAADPMAGVDPITPGGLPVYELVNRAAISLGWTANTLYAALMWMTAIAMGAGAFIATGSLLGGGIMLAGTLAVASSTGVIPAWIPIVMGLALVFIVVMSRSM